MSKYSDENKQLGIDVQHDIAKAFTDKLWCYVAVVCDGYSGLGVAVANERGYSPVPAFHYSVDNHDLAEKEAERLNAARAAEGGPAEEACLDIVISTMRRAS